MGVSQKRKKKKYLQLVASLFFTVLVAFIVFIYYNMWIVRSPKLADCLNFVALTTADI